MQTHIEERSCEDTGRRQSSASPEERSQKKPALLTPLILDFQRPELQGNKFLLCEPHSLGYFFFYLWEPM